MSCRFRLRLHYWLVAKQVFGDSEWYWVVDPVDFGHDFGHCLFWTSPSEEIIRKVFSTDYKPKAGCSHEVVRVHLVLCILLIPLNLLQVVNDLDIDLQIFLIFLPDGLKLSLSLLFLLTHTLLVLRYFSS